MQKAIIVFISTLLFFLGSNTLVHARVLIPASKEVDTHDEADHDNEATHAAILNHETFTHVLPIQSITQNYVPAPAPAYTYPHLKNEAYPNLIVPVPFPQRYVTYPAHQYPFRTYVPLNYYRLYTR